MSALEGKFDDFSEAQSFEIKNQIRELTKTRLELENEMLLSTSAEFRAKQILDFLKTIPDDLKDAHDVDFRQVFKAVIVRSRDDLIFVVGNENPALVSLKAKTLFNQRLKYKIRKTEFISEFGIYINY